MLYQRWVCGMGVACAMASAASAGVVLSTPSDLSSVGSYSQTFQVSDFPGAGFARLTQAVFSELEQGEGGNLGITSSFIQPSGFSQIIDQSGSSFSDPLFSGTESVTLQGTSTFVVFFINNRRGTTFTLESFDLTVGSQSFRESFTVTPGVPTPNTVPEPSSLLLAI